jgi:phosphotransferase system enzyme I (PtsP)
MLTTLASHSLSPLHDLVKKITEVMAKPQTLPTRLSLILKTIAHEMGASMAVLYLVTHDRYLDVYAIYDSLTHNSKKVRFRVGEGIVGFIASSHKSLLCENITNHPNFLFRPGVADHINLALVGVPLISPNGVIGVLTLQNPPSKPFDQLREKALMEIGNILAHLPELKRFPSIDTVEGKVSGIQTLKGVSFNPGLAIGTAVLHQPNSWKEIDFSRDTKLESQRLKAAIRDMIESIDRLVESAPNLEQDTQEVLASYRMIASDRGWIRKMQEYIQKGLTAEAAVQKVRRHNRERFAEIGNETLKSRLSDLEDLANRLLKHLTGKDSSSEKLPEATILVTHNLGPAELLDYDRRFIKGLILEEGVHTAHVAIVARALDIPVVGRIPLLLTHVEQGDKLIVDGERGTVLVNPTIDSYQDIREKMSQIKKSRILNKELRNKPCETLDGTHISLTLNAGLPIDLNHLKEFSFEGVGLYRTEIPFMMRSTFPDVKEQTEIYRDILDQTKAQPISFRTLDIGGDKVLPYMWRMQDENPVMGWRAIRVCLDKPALLRQQVRSLIHASEGKDLRLLFPMLTDLSEYREARHLVEKEWSRAKKNNLTLPTSLSFGVMLEVPSIVDQLDPLLKEVDFISIGTNDLFQFFFACDRTNPTVSNRYDVLSSSFLGYLRRIRIACDKAGIPVSVCGEMAGKPLEALGLLAIGFRSLSVAGPFAGQLKKMILSLPLKEAEAFISESLETYSPSLRQALTSFTKQHKVMI